MKLFLSVKIYLLILGVILLFSSCRKYEEGGWLYRAENKILRDWVMMSASIDGAEVDSIPSNTQVGKVKTVWEFYSDNTMNTSNGETYLFGTWSTTNSERAITITINAPASLEDKTQTYKIKRLTAGRNAEMVWEQLLDGKVYRYVFEVKD